MKIPFPHHSLIITIYLLFALGLTACGLLPDNNAPDASTVVATAESSTESSEPTPSPDTAEATVTSDSPGVINGRIWHDVCVNEGDPPDGCLSTANGGFQANGLLDSDEPGIADVIVRLAEGECPLINSGTTTVLGMSETVIAATSTDSEGDFLFPGLESGAYCLMVNTLDEPNRELLLPGNWSNESKGLQTITVAGGETITANFGWDHEFLPISAAALNCQDSAEFVEDVTIPDDTVIEGGATFTKTWRLRNVGTCDWTPAYALTFVDGFELDGPNIIPITDTVVPTNTVDFSVALTAPKITGTFRSDWQIYNANKREFFGVFGDEPIWVQIVVESVPEELAEPSNTVTATITATVPVTTPVTTPTFENAAVSGLVWEDEQGNGLQDEGEPLLREITVALYRDACPGTQLVATRKTNLGGGYVFTSLAPGTYCVTIDVFTPENVSLLSPGDWIVPESGTGSVTVELQSGENLTDVNFGWQFEE
jgi:hypothetical protein